MAASPRRGQRREIYPIRPCALVGSRWEPTAAAICGSLLLLVLAVELATPDDALLALALPPVLVAVWTMSGRFAAVVGLVAAGLVALVFLAEPSNRVTLTSIGAVGLIIAVSARLYAVRFADALPSRCNHRFPRAKFSERARFAAV